jgi:hypothetical protein
MGVPHDKDQGIKAREGHDQQNQPPQGRHDVLSKSTLATCTPANPELLATLLHFVKVERK